jgi:hypothetical protein
LIEQLLKIIDKYAEQLSGLEPRRSGYREEDSDRES